MSLTLSKLPHGLLNDKLRERVYESFDVQRDSIGAVLRRVLNAQFSENYSLVNTEFRGVCLYVLSDEELQSLASDGALGKIADTSQKSLARFKACRVYIPEIHTSRALPDDIFNPTKKEKLKIEAFFPVYISESEEVGNKPLSPGNIVTIKIKNHNGGGTYTSVLNSSNSVRSIYNDKGIASSDLFKCEIFRFSRITNTQGAGPSSGIVITDAKQQSNNKLDEATLKQQYIKYLYEKELFFTKSLRENWDSKSVFKGVLDDEFLTIEDNFSTEEKQNAKRLAWLLMYKLSAFTPTGVTNIGFTVAAVDALGDEYGIFKTTKEKYDKLKLKIKLKSDRNDIEEQILQKSHSDLLDPKFSIAYFLVDFEDYLIQNQSSFAKASAVMANADDAKSKKLITNYFTKNDDRINFIFTNDYTQIGQTYDEETGFYFDEDLPDVTQFQTFQAWISSAVGGAAIDISSFEKVESERPNNSQVLEQERPPDTPDECHSNYPQRNSYVEHVDAQKALMRRYIESPISGQDLNILSFSHKGVNNIKMGDILVNTPFKVIRYDGQSGFPGDSNRWFSHKNLANFLIFNKNYKNGYYKPNQFITKVTMSSLGLQEQSNDKFKNNLNLMVNIGKPLPHFLIEPDGQVIQLIDAAIMVNTGLPNENSSINISFVEGIGTIKPISGENNAVINNYILVNPGTQFNNMYRPHKIGSKAALQAADKLIKFLISKTKIKYNVAAQDFKLKRAEINKSGIQAYGHYKGVSGMNFIYYAWTYGLAFKNDGINLLSNEYVYDMGMINE